MSTSETAVTLLTGPLGGGLLGFGLWELLKEPCPVGTLQIECVHLAGQTSFGPAGLSGIGVFLGFVIAGVIVLSRDDGDTA
ncbi:MULTISPECIES: hypothetical protein [unclassified Knoellia]|uniref:hypothetical protein n=1 Tax=Knoellia altitudinis TaxID=3404795 RepID=UPI003614FFF2